MTPDERKQVQALISREAWSEARAALERVPSAQEDPDAIALRAEVEAGDGQLETAASLYERALEMRPEHRGALYNSSLVLSDLGRHEDAMTSLEALIEVEGETPSVLNDLAYEYMEAGHNVPAHLAACRAEQLSTDEANRCLSRLNAATALANMGQRTESRARIDAMLKDCTGACGERDAATELRESLDPRHPRRTVSG